jgi:ubiquinone/menaquinone biosynthesis C-methylase UbiE
MEKETHWAQFADDLQKRTDYIVGKHDMEIARNQTSALNDLGKTLEVGCGTGTYSKILERAAKHLTATDLSDTMVSVTTKLFAERKNVCVEKADCFALPYSDSAFDTVFMANILHVIPEPERAVREARRVLKKYGKLAIISYTFEGMTFLNKVVMMYRYLKVFGKPSADAHTLTVKKTREMLYNCGFKINEAVLIGDKTKAIFVDAQAV